MDSLKYYLYNIPEPNSGKSSPIQKGLIPRLNQVGGDLCEEGLGFGVPILQCTRDFFFPGTAITGFEGEIRGRVVKKTYVLDLIERLQEDTNRVGKFSWLFARLVNAAVKSIIGQRFLRVYKRAFHSERAVIHYQTSFIRVHDHGTITSTYFVDAENEQIIIRLDFSGINKRNVQRIYVSNELGGHYFTRYRDSSGLVLQDDQIGEWKKINAKRAMFYAPNLKIGFLIEVPRGVEAFMGRELISSEICWSGIILSVPHKILELNYTIYLGSIKKLKAMTKMLEK